MKKYKFAVVVAALTLVSSGQSQVLTFNDRVLFEQELKSAQTEDFEEGIIPAASYSTIHSPLDSTTNSHWFPSGSIVSGIRFSSVSFEPSGMGLLLWGSSVDDHGNSKEIGAASASDSMVITFLDQKTTAVGFDFRAFFASGTATVRLFGVNNELLSEVSLDADKNASFFGATSSMNLSHLTLETSGFLFGIDNVTFGEASAVPAPGAALVMILTGLNTYRRRRKKSS